jgi:sulfur-carrier protein adenylyltransferase/sulfurtransferase
MKTELSSFEKQQYEKHLMLPNIKKEGQLKLKNAHVVIVGMGGLGNPCATYLTSAGIGKITLVDADKISISNLQRQVLFSHQDIGLLKVEVAKKKLQALNPSIEINVHKEFVSLNNALSTIQKPNVVIDCSDNFETRYFLNDYCVKNYIPLSYAAIYKFDGQLCFFDMKKNSPCLRCLFPNLPPQGEIQNCAEAGVLGVLPGVFGVLQARDTIKFLLDSACNHKVTFWDVWADEFKSIPLTCNTSCETCSETHRNFFSLEKRHEHFTNQTSEKEENLMYKNINASEALAFIQNKNVLVLDVRNAEERIASKIQTQHTEQHIPVQVLTEKINSILQKSNILIYCQSGIRSAKACEILATAGFTELYNLSGGMKAWGK